LCDYTRKNAVEVKAIAERDIYGKASTAADLANTDGMKYASDDGHLHWDSIMRGSKYHPEDRMPPKEHYRKILASIALCPECKRWNFF
jgi:hypothetical protein